MAVQYPISVLFLQNLIKVRAQIVADHRQYDEELSNVDKWLTDVQTRVHQVESETPSNADEIEQKTKRLRVMRCKFYAAQGSNQEIFLIVEFENGTQRWKIEVRYFGNVTEKNSCQYSRRC